MGYGSRWRPTRRRDSLSPPPAARKALPEPPVFVCAAATPTPARDERRPSSPELLTKPGRPPPPPSKKAQVRHRLAAGQSVERIAREMGISPMAVYNHVYMLRKAGVVMCKWQRAADSVP